MNEIKIQQQNKFNRKSSSIWLNMKSWWMWDFVSVECMKTIFRVKNIRKKNKHKHTHITWQIKNASMWVCTWLSVMLLWILKTDWIWIVDEMIEIGTEPKHYNSIWISWELIQTKIKTGSDEQSVYELWRESAAWGSKKWRKTNQTHENKMTTMKYDKCK